MFNIVEYPEIIIHIKSVSRIHHINSAGWHGCFCPFCDDATRKFNPTHGHFWISSTFPIGHCFRCGIKVSLYKYLIHTGFKDQSILKFLYKLASISYNGDTSRATSFERTQILPLDQLLSNMKRAYIDVQRNHPNEYVIFKKYIIERCLDINPVNFLIIPQIYKKDNVTNILATFLNFDGQFVTSRAISQTASRYYKGSGKKQFYFFQNINTIDTYKNIVICEGAFDLINLYNYYPQFKNSFFIAIGDANYKGLIVNLVNTFLLIGEYELNIVFDKGVKRLDQLKNSILTTTNILNPQIGIEMFEPILSKDVSEIMLLTKI